MATKDIVIEYIRRKDELMGLPVGKYKAVIDLKGDKILVTNTRMKRHWCKLCDLIVEKDTKKAREDAARVLFNKCKNEKKMCKTTLVALYGKKIADKAPVWQYADNPYYKSASQMQIYLAKSMEWLYGNSQ